MFTKCSRFRQLKLVPDNRRDMVKWGKFRPGQLHLGLQTLQVKALVSSSIRDPMEGPKQGLA